MRQTISAGDEAPQEPQNSQKPQAARAVRARSPQELLAVVPLLLGFMPEASLVVIGLAPPRDRVRVTLRYDLRMRADLTPEMWKAATTDAAERLCLPEIDHDALTGLKFSEALPERLATATLAARLADTDAAATILSQPVRFSWSDQTNR